MRTASRFAVVVLAFFALYALTAGHGRQWGDSAEFLEWILAGDAFVCGPHFSNAHPLYVAFCRLVAKTPFAVTLVSALFGALSVGGLFLCSRRLALSVLFGLSQMLWWLSTRAEVQTMSLALTSFETAAMILAVEGRRSWRTAALCALALLAGVHLGVHNFATLSLPVYAALLVVLVRGGECRPAAAACAVACWLVGASPWLWAVFTRGPADVLVGAYGAKVAGLWPDNWTQTAFNFALASVSFAAPAAVSWWERRTLLSGAAFAARGASATGFLLALFAVNAAFFVRYFVPDQSQFLLPTLFFAYLLLRKIDVRPSRAAALACLQILMPVLLHRVVSQLPVPEERRGLHPGRDEARYFILPWEGIGAPLLPGQEAAP